MTSFQKIMTCIFIRSWWVIAFILLCTILLEQRLKERDDLYQQLTEQSLALELEKQTVLRHQLSLQLQINSQSDLAWIEMTLMKGLGLVPEGQQKVFFYPDERCGTMETQKSNDSFYVREDNEF